jgi:hypothetical protein
VFVEMEWHVNELKNVIESIELIVHFEESPIDAGPSVVEW